LPKGGGAIRGIGEKFAANPVTGTGSLNVPIACSPGRSGFGPQLSLAYDSGAGNGPFGLGWNLSLPAITRKTDKGLPRYNDADESDVFVLSGAEDLVPVTGPEANTTCTIDGVGYRVQLYRPRIEGLFARIERWTDLQSGEVHWRSISRDNITTSYGKTSDNHIADELRVFSWLICESFDDKGNAIVYEYAKENSEGIDPTLTSEGNRTDSSRSVNRYLKRIKYGNRVSRLLQPDLSKAKWLFEVVFDYGENHFERLPKEAGQHQRIRASAAKGGAWQVRPDPFSTYRAGFEVRSYRRCARVLMFHNFDELGSESCLVRSTEFHYNDFDYSQPAAIEAELAHKGSTRIASFIRSVTQSGYLRDEAQPVLEQNNVKYVTYREQSLPPIELDYSQATIQEEIQEVDEESLENLPTGVGGTGYQWVDLDGEGLSGVLSEQGGAWFYKRNLSALPVGGTDDPPQYAAKFGPVERLATIPSTANLSSGQQLLDLGGDGRLDVLEFDGLNPGFFERTSDAQWEQFRSFLSLPNIAWKNPNLRFVDLTGDGHADILITEDEAFTWHPSLAEEGFGPAQRVRQVFDEEKGPRLLFADGTQSIYVADMSGDGLADLVRVRNGEVCYWANLGYGRFGAKVTMDNSPWFDHPDQFDQSRLRLADIDGSGTSDIIYLGRDGVRLYFNQSGNRWSEPRRLKQFPRVDHLSSVMTVDLLGNGTACLVWSSPLPGDAWRPMRYIDLMGGQKPHLLISVKNNLGAQTQVRYAPSTKFYLADKAAGKPLVTRLSFPVHCVEKVTVKDQWRQTSFSSTYSYHHGYFDGIEREFRGFGRVEQVDVEGFGEFANGNAASPYITADKTLYQPPIKTVTWYHTGAFLDKQRILSQFETEYFPNWLIAQPGAPAIDPPFAEKPLPEPDLESQNLSNEEWEEALRACKGMILRQEAYELDVDALEKGEQRPVKLYSTAYHNCHIQRLQPQGENRHAVFLVAESEAITYHYELDLRDQPLRPDPRIAHTLNLSFDEYGNVQQSVAVAYPRVHAHKDASLNSDQLDVIHAVQQERHLAYSETHYTEDAIDQVDPQNPAPIQNYRLRQPYEVQTYELTGVSPALGLYFELAELRGLELSLQYPTADPGSSTSVGRILYHELPPNNAPCVRLVEHARTLFLKNDLGAPLPLGTLGTLGLQYEHYKLALTDKLLDAVFTTADGNKIDAAVAGGGTARSTLANWKASGYISGAALANVFGPQADGEYWMRSGVAGYAADAAQHFYLPERYEDPFGNLTTLTHDGKYDFYVESAKDARDNATAVTRFDFRLLAPAELQDINGNLSEVVFDILGMPTAAALKGKGAEGDNLDAFDEALLHPSPDTVILFFTGNYDEAIAGQMLAGASARHLYYFGEKVEADGSTTWGHHPPCACGIVREKHVAQLAVNEQSSLQTAFEYSDGMGAVLVKKVQAEAEPGPKPLRWIASGKTILNNKGKPVKQYEPYFSDNEHRFEEPLEVGVTPILYYDAPGRLVRTELPDGSFSRADYSPWHVASYDPSDTLLEPGNAWYALKTAANATAEEKRAAQLTTVHAGTPAVTFLDSLGRNVVSIAHNRRQYPDDPSPSPDEKSLTFTKLDAEGKPLWIRDARKNLVMQYIRPPMPNHQAADAASGFVPCYDIAGNLLYQHSMDAGERWTLNDAAGKPMFAWDSNERRDENGVALNEDRVFSTFYDALHRPTEQWLTINAGSPQMIGRSEYIDASSNVANAQSRNLCGQLHQHYDPSGLTQTERIDFKGSPLELHRCLVADYKAPVIDWQTTPANPPESHLEAETFIQITEYDALKRMTRLYNWHHGTGSRVAVYEPHYNQRSLLESEDLVVRATKTATGYSEGAGSKRTPVIQAIAYDAKGQRQAIGYGNDTLTRYQYDPKTFRLVQLRTTRPGFNPAFPNPAGQLKNDKVLQNLFYTYDPVGNITEIRDDAYEPAFFQNQQVDAQSRYTYDALYRLISATGRENGAAIGASAQFEGPPETVDFPKAAANALRNYTQTYHYDPVGNIEQMQHSAGSGGSWTRAYQYAVDSNRLLGTDTGDPQQAVAYQHDPHGNMLNLANVAPEFFIRWDYRDMIQAFNGLGGGWTYYNYTADKQRTRKVNENQLGARKVWERIYLGGLELYRRYGATGLVEEIESVHVVDGTHRVLLMEDVLLTDGPTLHAGALYRYQYGNHLGSAGLELDEKAQVISYEEFHPYGTTSYQAARNAAEVSIKRYRYTGMERDEETGLHCHGARYYAPWLGRWTAADPSGLSDGPNLYLYVRGSPITLNDPSGRGPPDPEFDRQMGQMTVQEEKEYKIQKQKDKEAEWAEQARIEAEERKTPEYQEGLRVGKEFGKTLAEFDNAVKLLQEKHGTPGELLAGGGKSVWEEMTDKEKVDFLSKSSEEFAKLPQLSDFSDSGKAALAKKGYDAGVRSGYSGQDFKTLLLKLGVEAAIFIATALSLRAGIQRVAKVPIPKGSVIHLGAELDALPGEVIVNPGRQAMPIQALRELHPDKMVIQAGVEKMPFGSGVASMVKGNKLPAGSIDWKAAASEIDRVLMRGGRVDIAVMGDLQPLKEALEKLGWKTISLDGQGTWLRGVKP